MAPWIGEPVPTLMAVLGPPGSPPENSLHSAVLPGQGQSFLRRTQDEKARGLTLEEAAAERNAVPPISVWKPGQSASALRGSAQEAPAANASFKPMADEDEDEFKI